MISPLLQTDSDSNPYNLFKQILAEALKSFWFLLFTQTMEEVLVASLLIGQRGSI